MSYSSKVPELLFFCSWL